MSAMSWTHRRRDADIVRQCTSACLRCFGCSERACSRRHKQRLDIDWSSCTAEGQVRRRWRLGRTYSPLAVIPGLECPGVVVAVRADEFPGQRTESKSQPITAIPVGADVLARRLHEILVHRDQLFLPKLHGPEPVVGTIHEGCNGSPKTTPACGCLHVGHRVGSALCGTLGTANVEEHSSVVVGELGMGHVSGGVTEEDRHADERAHCSGGRRSIWQRGNKTGKGAAWLERASEKKYNEQCVERQAA